MPEYTAHQQLSQLGHGLRERGYSTAYGDVGEQALIIRDDLFKALGERNAEVERLRAALQLIATFDVPKVASMSDSMAEFARQTLTPSAGGDSE